MIHPIRAFFALASLCLLALPAAGQGDAAAPSLSLGEALRQGSYQVAFRFRAEGVSEDAQPDDALATTLRSTLSYRSKACRGFSLFGEFENVAAIGGDSRYRNAGAGSLGNGVTGRPVVADPAGTEVNQLYLRWSVQDTEVDLGRIEMNLGNQRFVGAVGWRQNHQTFDGLRIANKSLDKTTLTYAYLDSVNRVFGDRQPMASHLFDAQVATPVGKVTGYAYLLDYDLAAQSALSTATIGAALAGDRELGGGKLFYDFEIAQQRDHGDNPNDVDAGYLRAELGGGKGAWSAKAGYELLEGSPRDGRFTTPLATLHKWNGWADKFLTTPPNGLADLWLAVAGKIRDVAVTAILHDFSADTGSADYGSEIDLQAVYTTSWKQQLGLKLALYDADEHSTDTDKWMVWTAWSFDGGG